MWRIMLQCFSFLHRWTAFTSPRLCWLSCWYAKDRLPEFLCEHLLLYNAHEAAAFIAAVSPPLAIFHSIECCCRAPVTCTHRHTADLSLLVRVGVCVCVSQPTCSVVQHKKTHATEFTAWLTERVFISAFRYELISRLRSKSGAGKDTSCYPGSDRISEE